MTIIRVGMVAAALAVAACAQSHDPTLERLPIPDCRLSGPAYDAPMGTFSISDEVTAYAAHIDGQRVLTISLNGVFDDKMAAEFAMADRVYGRPGDVLIVTTEGPGGYVLHAARMAIYIRDVGAHTVVPKGGECASACGIVFAAGRSRSISGSGSFGLHSASRGMAVDHEFNDMLVGMYAEIGADAEAIELLIRSAHPMEMIWLSGYEAHSLGIATELID